MTGSYCSRVVVYAVIITERELIELQHTCRLCCYAVQLLSNTLCQDMPYQNNFAM